MAKKVHSRGGRFGTRYGKSTRDKISKAEQLVRSSKKSPFCNKNTVKRLSSGLWVCTKTGIKFTGRAYTFDPKSLTGTKEKLQEEYVEPEA
ncbi:MAG: 50S ribosomal protein L37ae [Nanoarchaeota archaeon]